MLLLYLITLVIPNLKFGYCVRELTHSQRIKVFTKSHVFVNLKVKNELLNKKNTLRNQTFV